LEYYVTDLARRQNLLRASRVCAVGALIGIVLLTALVVDFLVSNIGWVVLGLLGLAIVAVCAWWALTGRGARRRLAIAGALAGIGAVVVALVGAAASGDEVIWHLIVFGVLLMVVIIAARAAMVNSTRAMVAVPIRHTGPPAHPVLICNPRSGGGKVDRFGLVELAESMGVETLLLEPGSDLEELARSAVAAGADCLGMAGGDGSQALVASIAVEHDLPFVCISAGTRNHFALDLGLNRDDPRVGMRAFRDGLERTVDYATVNGRFFVNNVSLGVYATIVQEDDYREHKAETSSAALPELLGNADRPFDLQFTAPDGSVVAGSFLIQVSNNPYVLGPSLDVSQRRRLDLGTLGIFALTASSGAEAAQIVTRMLAGRRSRLPGNRLVFEFTAPEFQVRSRSGRAFAGVDGEALELVTPVDFRIHAGGLRLLVPKGNREAAIRRQARGVYPRHLVSLVLHPDHQLTETTRR
jgi:diacylglycerol kinase family enzyme